MTLPARVSDDEAATSPIRLAPPPPPWRARLPAVSATDAHWHSLASRAAARSAERLVASLVAPLSAALETSVTVLEVRYGRSAPISGARFSIALAGGDTATELRACPSVCAALVAAVSGVGTTPTNSPPDRLHGALLGHALLVSLAAIDEPIRPRVCADRPGVGVATLEVLLRIGTQSGTVQLDLDATAAAALLRLGATPAPLASHLASLPAPVEVGVGPVRLPFDVIDALRPGDALCPHPDFQRGAGPVFLASAGRPFAVGMLDEGRITVSRLGAPSSLLPLEFTMDDSSSVLFDVHVVLATLPSTLGELAAIEPGAVVSLDAPETSVRLVVGDRTIALGELVDVEGTLGVRITARSQR